MDKKNQIEEGLNSTIDQKLSEKKIDIDFKMNVFIKKIKDIFKFHQESNFKNSHHSPIFNRKLFKFLIKYSNVIKLHCESLCEIFSLLIDFFIYKLEDEKIYILNIVKENLYEILDLLYFKNTNNKFLFDKNKEIKYNEIFNKKSFFHFFGESFDKILKYNINYNLISSEKCEKVIFYFLNFRIPNLILEDKNNNNNNYITFLLNEMREMIIKYEKDEKKIFNRNLFNFFIEINFVCCFKLIEEIKTKNKLNFENMFNIQNIFRNFIYYIENIKKYNFLNNLNYEIIYLILLLIRIFTIKMNKEQTEQKEKLKEFIKIFKENFLEKNEILKNYLIEILSGNFCKKIENKIYVSENYNFLYEFYYNKFFERDFNNEKKKINFNINNILIKKNNNLYDLFLDEFYFKCVIKQILFFFPYENKKNEIEKKVFIPKIILLKSLKNLIHQKITVKKKEIKFFIYYNLIILNLKNLILKFKEKLNDSEFEIILDIFIYLINENNINDYKNEKDILIKEKNEKLFNFFLEFQEIIFNLKTQKFKNFNINFQKFNEFCFLIKNKNLFFLNFLNDINFDNKNILLKTNLIDEFIKIFLLSNFLIKDDFKILLNLILVKITNNIKNTNNEIVQKRTFNLFINFYSFFIENFIEKINNKEENYFLFFSNFLVNFILFLKNLDYLKILIQKIFESDFNKNSIIINFQKRTIINIFYVLNYNIQKEKLQKILEILFEDEIIFNCSNLNVIKHLFLQFKFNSKNEINLNHDNFYINNKKFLLVPLMYLKYDYNEKFLNKNENLKNPFLIFDYNYFYNRIIKIIFEKREFDFDSFKIIKKSFKYDNFILNVENLNLLLNYINIININSINPNQIKKEEFDIILILLQNINYNIFFDKNYFLENDFFKSEFFKNYSKKFNFDVEKNNFFNDENDSNNILFSKNKFFKFLLDFIEKIYKSTEIELISNNKEEIEILLENRLKNLNSILNIFIYYLNTYFNKNLNIELIKKNEEIFFNLINQLNLIFRENQKKKFLFIHQKILYSLFILKDIIKQSSFKLQMFCINILIAISTWRNEFILNSEGNSLNNSEEINNNKINETDYLIKGFEKIENTILLNNQRLNKTKNYINLINENNKETKEEIEKKEILAKNLNCNKIFYEFIEFFSDVNLYFYFMNIRIEDKLTAFSYVISNFIKGKNKRNEIILEIFELLLLCNVKKRENFEKNEILNKINNKNNEINFYSGLNNKIIDYVINDNSIILFNFGISTNLEFEIEFLKNIEKIINDNNNIENIKNLIDEKIKLPEKKNDDFYSENKIIKQIKNIINNKKNISEIILFYLINMVERAPEEILNRFINQKENNKIINNKINVYNNLINEFSIQQTFKINTFFYKNNFNDNEILIENLFNNNYSEKFIDFINLLGNIYFNNKTNKYELNFENNFYKINYDIVNENVSFENNKISDVILIYLENSFQSLKNLYKLTEKFNKFFIFVIEIEENLYKIKIRNNFHSNFKYNKNKTIINNENDEIYKNLLNSFILDFYLDLNQESSIRYFKENVIFLCDFNEFCKQKNNDSFLNCFNRRLNEIDKKF